MTIIEILTALILGFLAAVLAIAFQRWRDRRPPSTDQGHGENIARYAFGLNRAMHLARAAGLNPTLKLSPIDDELPPGSRPIIAGVERIPDASHRQLVREIRDTHHIGARRFSKFFNDREVEVIKYQDDNNWWFVIVGEKPPRVRKAETPFSKMPRTREEAYAIGASG